MKPKKRIDADDAAYRLVKEILEAEAQIQRGEVVPWADVKRRAKRSIGQHAKYDFTKLKGRRNPYVKVLKKYRSRSGA